ncbi:MAG: hypothetical protein A3D74_05480 [Candidatus Levybacteria bacterium RIFCSPHIGHO2_02_FULL_37_13]|nr:MAG: hypothetical protein A3D74_05480 [Candidatus Levybacteria bacterium RIFCSPHIGHO2_02_FULL_37_13]OGH29263.1 MAG: hypothetical protein A3E40_03370 [Candidatus Levybacteria bacterium RIFCSPHIGHO2_12_FULL_37_9]OGH40395.1 MAG: hypothetical protein A3B41_02705 [Candidatus Levybacteria bacterium RIFCSPLOWO2_01_FULL_37_26]
MNKNVIIGIVIIIAIVGFLMLTNKPTTPVSQPEETTQAPASTEVTVALSEQNASGESGTATLIEVDGKVKVTLNLTGATQDVTQPAHIHVGSCPDVGEVKYALNSPVNGVSETMLDVTLDQIKSGLPLGINVHKSETEAATYVSCGDITL